MTPVSQPVVRCTFNARDMTRTRWLFRNCGLPIRKSATLRAVKSLSGSGLVGIWKLEINVLDASASLFALFSFITTTKRAKHTRLVCAIIKIITYIENHHTQAHIKSFWPLNNKMSININFYDK